MKILLALIAFFGVAVAQADTAGVWTGNMEYFVGGVSQESAAGQVTVTTDGVTYTVEDILFGETYSFDIQGNELMLNGAKVGELTGTSFMVMFDYTARAGCTQTVSLTMSADTQADYVNALSCADGYTDELKGTVTR